MRSVAPRHKPMFSMAVGRRIIHAIRSRRLSEKYVAVSVNAEMDYQSGRGGIREGTSKNSASKILRLFPESVLTCPFNIWNMICVVASQRTDAARNSQFSHRFVVGVRLPPSMILRPVLGLVVQTKLKRLPLTPAEAMRKSFMNLKMIVAILVISALPVCAQAQKPSAAKVTNAGAQKVVKMISGDKAKTQTYCDLVKLGDQFEEIDPKDTKKADELNQQMAELAGKLGPEYIALVGGLKAMDPDSKESKEINLTLDALDKLCAK
jgi:hypothetical protein